MLARIPQLESGGTQSWRRYRAAYFLTAPVALAFLGAETSDSAVVLRTQGVDRAEETVVLTADLEPTPGAPFSDFRDSLPGDTRYGTEGWTTPLNPDQDLPLYQQEPQRLFLIREALEHDAIYLRMNGSLDDHEANETVRQFTERALAAVRQHRNIIVDFRYNRGGDYTTVLPLVRGVADAVPADGRLYLITGPNTFSAGIIAGSQFKRFVPDRLTVVGEEVGDRLRFRGEGFVVTLPATGNQAYLAGAWDYVDEDCGWFDDCWMPNKLFLRGIGSLDPDIRVANTWASYREGRDLVVEAAFADMVRREAQGNTAIR
jgi:hypothetical protein